MSDELTLEEASEDGPLRNELAEKAPQVCSREFPGLWEKFQQVCRDAGIKPGLAIANEVMRALNNQEFAERLANIRVDADSLTSAEIRVEDAERVIELRERLQVEDDSGFDLDVNEILQQRLARSTGSPVGNVASATRDVASAASSDGSDQEVQELRSEINEVKSMLSEIAGGEVTDTSEGGGGSAGGTVNDVPSISEGGAEVTDEDDVGHLFGDDDSDGPIEGSNVDSTDATEVLAEETGEPESKFEHDEEMPDAEQQEFESINEDEVDEDRVSEGSEEDGGGEDG